MHNSYLFILANNPDVVDKLEGLIAQWSKVIEQVLAESEQVGNVIVFILFNQSVLKSSSMFQSQGYSMPAACSMETFIFVVLAMETSTIGIALLRLCGLWKELRLVAKSFQWALSLQP